MTTVQDSRFIVEQLIRVTAKESLYLERAATRLRGMNIDLSWIESLVNSDEHSGSLRAKSETGMTPLRNNDNKLSYAYLLTQHRIEQKARMTLEFLQIKSHEYERLRMEIEELKQEAEQKGLLDSVT